MGDVIPFKRKPKIREAKVIGHRLSFYTDEEIDIALLALNMYGFDKLRYTVDTMKSLDPLYIRACLFELKRSDLISSLGRRVINIIIDNMEEIRDAN